MSNKHRQSERDKQSHRRRNNNDGQNNKAELEAMALYANRQQTQRSSNSNRV